ncbi:MAG: glycosyltransferase [Candidatus Marinimicrobia bacterium]|nr:glycosyltransferase [Candidatus Neomarinimicrobiota bacterium]
MDLRTGFNVPKEKDTMRILVIAPHPFYQERGTPIDVLLVLRVLTARENTHVDLLTYEEGEDVSLPNLTIHRCRKLPGVKDIRPGFSVKKVVSDICLFFKARKLVKNHDFDFVHAGEEAVFIAMHLKRKFGVSFAYDLDSSIAQQMVEKMPSLSAFSRMFNWFESRAIQSSLINFPVCNALADLCEKNGSEKTVTLHDISQLDHSSADHSDLLRSEIDVAPDDVLFLYIGNLESYQGIDLLLESFQVALKKADNLKLAIIGGKEDNIQHYREMAAALQISENVFFLGPRPFENLAAYLSGATVTVCPRIRGINTPMKVFPFMHSGKPMLATDLKTHNQILTSNEAFLAAANPEDFGEAMVEIARDKELREKIGRNGKRFIEENHTFEAHEERLNDAYDWVEQQLREM